MSQRPRRRHDRRTQTEIADAIMAAARHLGSGDATTLGWGAIEHHGQLLSEKLDRIGDGLFAIADALTAIAENAARERERDEQARPSSPHRHPARDRSRRMLKRASVAPDPDPRSPLLTPWKPSSSYSSSESIPFSPRRSGPTWPVLQTVGHLGIPLLTRLCGDRCPHEGHAGMLG